MKNIARESIRSVYGSIDPNKKDNSFEVIYNCRLLFYNYIKK